MKIFQTPTSNKKNFWHFLLDLNDRRASPLCNAMGYYFGGYRDDKPEMTRENLKLVEYENQKICPACVEQAYVKDLIIIKIK